MSNEHIVQYLRYYVDVLKAPGYAVLVKGPWGVGKTHFTSNFVGTLKTNGKVVLWTSLYGVKTTDEIDQRLVLSALPYLIQRSRKLGVIRQWLEGKDLYQKFKEPAINWGGRLTGLLAKQFNIGAKIQSIGLASVCSADLIVFDDLERGILSAKEMLGYINQFVEQERRKILIVANEDEIDKNDAEYKRIREKVIGEVFELTDDIEAALQAFMTEMPNDDARAFVEKNRAPAISVFQQSLSKNLRVLRQVLLSWDRVYAAVEQDLRAKADAMTGAFRLFLTLGLETRLGSITADDLKGRMDNIVMASMREAPESKSALVEVSKKYPEVRLYDTVLSDDVLIHVLVEGRVDAAEINASLCHSEYFTSPGDESPWKTVWHGLLRDEGEYEEAFKKMEEQFAQRAFTDAGEVLHVFGLRLFAQRIGHLRSTEAQVVADCEAYIDDLSKSNQLELDRKPDDFWNTGAFGLGFVDAQGASFQRLGQSYWKAVGEAQRRSWPKLAKDLLELMATNQSAFYAKISWTNDDRDHAYLSVPIFSVVPVDQFVGALLALQPEDIRNVLTALHGRYEGGRLKHELQEEEVWIKGVHDGLLHRATTMKPIRKFAIENDVKRLITPIVSEGT